MLSGKELYQYKKDLFKDQEEDDIVATANVEAVADKVEKDLFLEGDVDDLDDLDDD